MKHIKSMDWIDWLLAVVFIGVAAAVLGMLIPPYGYPVGAALGAYMIYLAKRNRDRLKDDRLKNDQKE